MNGVGVTLLSGSVLISSYCEEGSLYATFSFWMARRLRDFFASDWVEEIIYHGAEHLGIAVDTDRGLLVPVIRDAGDLNMGAIARKIADVAARTRENKISPDELGGGTFTITNTGSRGALFDTPIINQPQVAILGVGSIVKRPMVIQGNDGSETIAIRSMVYLALSYDHRIVDGADAARFLSTLKERLEGGRFESDLGLS